MKKIILVLSIVLAGTFSVVAQERTIAGNPIDLMVGRISMVCKLTPDQEEKLRPIVQEFYQVKTENHQKYATNPEALKAADKENRQNLWEQVKTVLTADQIKAFKEYKQQQKEKYEAAKK